MSKKKQNKTVVIVGRTNVGKSTFFNRLATNVKSIAFEYEGVTRDFIKDQVTWQDITFDLIDSGGINLRKTQDKLFRAVQEQVIGLIEEADLVLFMADGTVGVLLEDREIGQFLHKLNKPVILLINKIDSKQAQDNLYEFSQIGFSVIQPISSEHGTDINTVLDLIVGSLPKDSRQFEQGKANYKAVLLGKPNVGKSSLMNKLVDYERSIVSEIPGTTREALSDKVKFYQDSIELVDTPGIRRKKSVGGEIEPLMVKSSFNALKTSNIVLLLIDGSQTSLVDQDLKLAFYSFTDQYKALIIIINKQDLMTEESKEELDVSFDYYKHLMKKVPVFSISCKTGKNIGKILPLINKVWTKYTIEIRDTELTALLIKNLQERPLYHLKQPLILYSAKMVKTAPPTIELIVNEPSWFGKSHLSYFENILRAHYDLIGVPVKFFVRK